MVYWLPFSQIYNDFLVLQNIKLATTQALKEKAGAVIHRFETRTLPAIEEMATKAGQKIIKEATTNGM